MAHNRFQLAEFLDDGNDLLAGLAGEHGHLNELVVHETVADDRRIEAVGQREHCEQFRFRAGFQTEIKRSAKVENLLDDVALLVNLDRIDATILARIVEFANGMLKGIVNLADAMAQNVGETHQDRQLDAARLQLIDEVFEVDGLFGALAWLDGDVAELVDAEVAFAPVADAVGFDGVDDLPLLHQFRLCDFRHRKGLHQGRGAAGVRKGGKH